MTMGADGYPILLSALQSNTEKQRPGSGVGDGTYRASVITHFTTGFPTVARTVTRVGKRMSLQVGADRTAANIRAGHSFDGLL